MSFSIGATISIWKYKKYLNWVFYNFLYLSQFLYLLLNVGYCLLVYPMDLPVYLYKTSWFLLQSLTIPHWWIRAFLFRWDLLTFCTILCRYQNPHSGCQLKKKLIHYRETKTASNKSFEWRYQHYQSIFYRRTFATISFQVKCQRHLTPTI